MGLKLSYSISFYCDEIPSKSSFDSKEMFCFDFPSPFGRLFFGQMKVIQLIRLSLKRKKETLFISCLFQAPHLGFVRYSRVVFIDGISCYISLFLTRPVITFTHYTTI